MIIQQNASLTASGDTQERLLETAIDIFGKHGFDGATTRMIANAANVNIAAIQYYYRSKEGLYQAVINAVVELIQAQLAPMSTEIAKLDISNAKSKEQARLLFEKLLQKVIAFIIASPDARRVSRIILREQMFPSTAYDTIFKGFMSSILDALQAVIVIISGNPSKRTAKIRAMAIMGQVLAFRVARETVARALDMEGYSSGETEEIQQVIVEHSRAILDALS